MEYTSRVPRVTMRPVFAPLRSIKVLMAVVEPWISSAISARSTPLMRRQSMIPLTSCVGVVRLLAWAKRPVASSKAIKSVKVPPISIATSNRYALLGMLKRYHGAMSKVDARRRCPWSLGSAQYLRYHDEEWGVPVHDDGRLFEFLILEGAQAGLAWATILNKRDNYRRAFARFDPAKVARPRLGSAAKLRSERESPGEIDAPTRRFGFARLSPRRERPFPGRRTGRHRDAGGRAAPRRPGLQGSRAARGARREQPPRRRHHQPPHGTLAR